MTFDQWMKQVDALLIRWHGLASDDLPDWEWMDAFEDELSPEEAVEAFLDGIEDNF